MDDVLVLVQPQLVQNDIGDFVPAGPPLTQQIFGSISSVNRAEWYSAGQEGRKPELVFTTPIINYSGQPEAEYRGTRYSIYRTYLRQGSDEMDIYANEVADTVKKTVTAVAKETVKVVKQKSPSASGAYKKSWAQKKTYDNTGSIQITVYNRKHYQLTHLLENGHAKTNGGRTRAFPHIAPAEEFAERELEQELRRKLGEGNP